MKVSKFPRFLMFLLFIFAFIVPVSFIVMALWNNILAVVIPVGTLNFWQALGIFALCRILFGGFPGRPGWDHGGPRGRMNAMRNKWMNLSEEERNKFKQGIKAFAGNEAASPRSESPSE